MRENSLREPSEEVGNWNLVVRDAEYEGERKSALMKHGEGTNFQDETNKRFFRCYTYIYKKFLNILVNVAIKVVDKKGYLDLLFKI